MRNCEAWFLTLESECRLMAHEQCPHNHLCTYGSIASYRRRQLQDEELHSEMLLNKLRGS
jgi:hypothetical protein